MTEAMTPLSGGADDLPPLPAKRRRFFCTKCGSSECKPETAHERHPWCAKCDYLGFGEDCDYNDAETQAYARQAIESDRARRQGALTDEQIEAIFRETFKAWGHQGSQHLMKHFARAIIAALSLKGAKD